MNKEVAFILMQEQTTPYGLDITREMIENSIHTFESAPLVYTRGNDENKLESIIEDSFILGIIKRVELQENQDGSLTVIGIVELNKPEYEELMGNYHFDNWVIDHDENDESFTYEKCIIYGDKDIFDKLKQAWYNR